MTRKYRRSSPVPKFNTYTHTNTQTSGEMCANFVSVVWDRRELGAQDEHQILI